VKICGCAWVEVTRGLCEAIVRSVALSNRDRRLSEAKNRLDYVERRRILPVSRLEIEPLAVKTVTDILLLYLG
jgi:hypothetical protein